LKEHETFVEIMLVVSCLSGNKNLPDPNPSYISQWNWNTGHSQLICMWSPLCKKNWRVTSSTQSLF